MASILDWLHKNSHLPVRRMNGIAGGHDAEQPAAIITTFDRRAGRARQTISAMQITVEDWEVGIALASGELALGDTLGGMMLELAHDETGIADLEQDVFEYIDHSQGRTEMIRTVHASLGAALARVARG